jgi:hypothetical protein
MKRFSLFLLLVITKLCSINAQQLEPIDSVFLNSFTYFSKNIENIKDSVWPDMQIGPYSIFRLNGPAFLMNHTNPPQNAKLINDNIYLLNQSDYELVGATQTLINGELTAHNDYGQQFYSSVNQFYAELFHELHHVYQRNYINNLKFDNPADLLTYPEDERNFAIKQYENTLLLEMLLGAPDKFKQNLNLFYTCRSNREEIIGIKYLNYEKGAESVEGPAMFCEYHYMQQFSRNIIDQEYIHHRYFYSLTEPFYSRNNLRGKCLLTGLVQCLILSIHFKDWQSEYYSSGLFLYDYFVRKLLPQETILPDLSYDRAKAKYFTSIEKQKHFLNYETFTKQNGIKLILSFKEYPEFRGFDPMHAEAVNDSTILHSTLLKLGKGNNSLNIVNYKTISIIADQIWFVKTVELFVPEKSISFDNNKLILSNNGNVEIKWNYINKSEKGNEVIITLE